MNAVAYLIDDICYYVTTTQNRSLLKNWGGEPAEAAIRKVAYTTGRLGDRVESPDGNGAMILVYPAGMEPKLETAADDPKLPPPEPIIDRHFSDALPVVNPSVASPSIETPEAADDPKIPEDPLGLNV